MKQTSDDARPVRVKQKKQLTVMRKIMITKEDSKWKRE